MTRHSAVVLAAGLSTRLGQAKQLLCVNGESLLRRAARLAGETQPQVLVVVTPGGEAFDAELVGLPARHVCNPSPADGMGSSLRLAAPCLGEAETVLVMVCDQPRLDLAHLQALIEAAAHSPARCAATLSDEVLGSPAVVPAAWFEDRAGLTGDHGFGQRLRQTPGIAACRSLVPLQDIDQPQDLQAARAAGWIDALPR